MLPASSSRYPSKRRRMNSPEKNLPGPSAEVLPLVSPNLVQKSSKDPNRGMYPHKRQKPKSKSQNLSSPTFSKASDLLKNSSDYKTKVSKMEDVAVSFTSARALHQKQKVEKVDKDYKPETVKSRFSETLSCSRKRQKSFSNSDKSVTNKIIHYFTRSQHSTKKCKIPGVVKKSKSTLLSTENPSTSTGSKNGKSQEKNELFFKKYSNCYGLLGESVAAEDSDNYPNYFERLPTHVMESIFCQIPFIDMMKCRLVCRTWNEVIADPKFMEWKKMYYSSKLKKTDICAEMHCMFHSMGNRRVEDCFKVLIKYMATKYCRKPSSDMRVLLSKNAKAVVAEQVLVERFPELEEKDSRAWCIFAVAILISETVWDVYSLYQCLFSSKSSCSVHDVTDAMYCIATFLYYFVNHLSINHGLHYRVYYALYLIENNLPCDSKGVQALNVVKGLPGQQSIHAYSESSKSYLTYEQLRILNHHFEPKQIIKIVALAGTGKTTTLIHLARLYPQVKFLNIMFNKAVCERAKECFPSNVTCKTAHSLAYKFYGKKLQHKLVTKIRPHDIVTFLNCNKGSHLQIHSYAALVLNTISSFVQSSAKEITKSDVPTTSKDIDGTFVSELDRDRLRNDAIQIWNMMIDKDEKLFRITHDVYLKLYQLSKPKFTDYQCIMVDEAQDCNPAMLDIVLSQNLPLILVGDPNQQIYGFRGANNALQNIVSTHTYYLTKSFRFGPEIAYIASCVLECLKRNTRETIVGNAKPSFINGRTHGQYAIISRTNVQLFNEAVRLCCHLRFRNNEPTTVHGAFAGGIKRYGFDQLLDIYKLKCISINNKDISGPITDKFISKFKSFNELQNYAKSVEDSDLLSKIELVRQHGHDIPTYIRIIKEKCSYHMEFATVVFSTAHKSKGLEFDTVCLTDDFAINRLPIDALSSSLWSEESSVMYVALTRAKTCLLLPEKLLKVLLMFAQEKFEYPVASKILMKENPSLICAQCADSFIPHTVLVLVRREIQMAGGRVIRGGPLCMKCGTEPTVRPQVHVETVIMYLDPTDDSAHRSMSALVGPLPSDPPILYDSFAPINEMEVVYVINLNL